MTKSKKNNKNKKVKNKSKKILKGGELKMSPLDLKNSHLCNISGKVKESPGNEFYTSINEAFELNSETLGYFLYSFRKSKDKWFKFVVFNNNDVNHIYIINGAPINKHSVCLIQGLIDVTKDTGEYPDLHKTFKNLVEIKSEKGIIDDIESNQIVVDFNTVINRDIPCMPVISAGSGTVNDDDSICINTKSGHYKPEIENMEIAKQIFEQITSKNIIITMKIDKQLLIEKYGDKADNYSGICI
jgi:hypothetical protein